MIHSILTKGISRAKQADAPLYRPKRPSDRTTCIAPFLGAFGPSSFAISPINWRRILMISSGLVTICTKGEGGYCQLSSCPETPIETYDLTTTCRTTSHQLPEQRDPSRLRVHRFRPHKVVDRQFQGLFESKHQYHNIAYFHRSHTFSGATPTNCGTTPR